MEETNDLTLTLPSPYPLPPAKERDKFQGEGEIQGEGGREKEAEMKVRMLKDVVVAVLERRVFVGEVVEVPGSVGMDLVRTGAALEEITSASYEAVYKQEAQEKQAGKRAKKQIKRAIMGGK